MSDTKAFKLTKADLYVNEEKLDIRAIIAEFQWYESIDSPFVRLDIAVLDSIDLDQRLFGTEKLEIEFQTYAAQLEDKKSKETKIKATLKMYKIGSVVKRERAKMYILHFVPEAMYHNESNRAFGLYGKKNGKDDVVERMLKEQMKIPKKDMEIEAYTKMNVLCPNWRPVDAISYVTDKVTRVAKGKGTKKQKDRKNIGVRQAGFLFYQNKRGYNFKSMDLLCEQPPLVTYVYGQKNVGTDDPAADKFRIETIKYPDRANQLEKLRQGVYQTATFGVVMAAPTSSSLPLSNANTDDDGPEGTVTGPVVTTIMDMFDKASTLEKGFPYAPEQMEEFKDNHPTRTKLKILPKLAHQQAGSDSTDGGAEEESASIMNAAAYANQRWWLLNTHTLTITVSGNTALFAGAVIKVDIPTSQQKNKNKLPKDRVFSGKYLIKGIKHTYTKDDMTTELYLCRDSLPTAKNNT